MTKIKIFGLVLSFLSIFSLGTAAADHYSPHLLRGNHRNVCAVASSSKSAACNAKVVTNKNNQPDVTAGPSGYGPLQFHTAYQLPNTSAKPATIAVVDAYDDPYVTSDLAAYDKAFGLPVFPSCSNLVKTGCFQKVNQYGGTFYPSRSSGWSLEIALDVETAHQTCQNCKLILVEASNASYSNLMTSVDRARQMGATVISNSYGSSEFSSETFYDSHFKYPGVAFIFSSGDSGYGSSYPAGSPYVTAAGGTSLLVDPSTNAWQSETAWSAGGSGCSLIEKKPAFQTDTGCLNRTIADVAADADPNTGAAVYDSYPYAGQAGWFQVGGTSLAAPIIAGAYALSNNVGSTTFANTIPYIKADYTSNLHDVTAGSNGVCSVAYLCQAGAGYDAPTGLGSPNGLGAF